MNLFASLNLQTMGVTIGKYDTIDSVFMQDHFKKLRETYPKAKHINLILDQGPYNKSMKTQETAVKCGIKIHYLPPYSPNLNPIERVWKVLTDYTRNNVFFKSARDFKEAVQAFFHGTWPTIAQGMTDQMNDNFQILKSVP